MKFMPDTSIITKELLSASSNYHGFAPVRKLFFSAAFFYELSGGVLPFHGLTVLLPYIRQHFAIPRQCLPFHHIVPVILSILFQKSPLVSIRENSGVYCWMRRIPGVTLSNDSVF